jgi:NAD(P)H-hydrate repair Nnr-like enzyme with NAD(P)H-hydrate dehydratase domain
MSTPNHSATDGNTAVPAAATWTDLDEAGVRSAIRIPSADDDKYSRGVLGVRTGSAEYPGAAVLGVEAAARTGVGMIRFLGDERVQAAVLQRRPEIVTTEGRVQAWLVGSGTSASTRSENDTVALRRCVASGLPVVMDAGALDQVGLAGPQTVITPHAGELERLLSSTSGAPDRQAISANPQLWAVRAAERFGVTVVLKGFTTHICDPEGSRLAVTAESSWAATAGSGDVLAGIIAAVVSGAADTIGDPGRLAELAAAGVWIHQRAVSVASAGGPVVALDIAEAVPRVIATLLRTNR